MVMPSIKFISKLQSLLAPLLLDWTWGLNFWFYQPFLRFNKIQHVHNKTMTHKNAIRILTAMSLYSLPKHDKIYTYMANPMCVSRFWLLRNSCCFFCEPSLENEISPILNLFYNSQAFNSQRGNVYSVSCVSFLNTFERVYVSLINECHSLYAIFVWKQTLE